MIELPRWKWWPILNLIILTVRPGRKGRDYDKIWNTKRNEGPLKTITRAQAEKLAAALAEPGIVVDWAMRYANPTYGEPLAQSAARGMRPPADRAALSAICRGHDGHGLRRSLSRPHVVALAAGGARSATLLR